MPPSASTAHLVWAPDPVLLRLGSFQLRWYGLLLALAIALGFAVWYRRARRHGESAAMAEGWLWWSVAATLVGGRLGELLFYRPRELLADPASLFAVADGGMSSHGVTVALLLAAWAFARRHGTTVLRVGDYFAPGIALGACLVRLGNFFNSEIVGRPSEVPWAVVFARHDALPRHPVQLYEAAAAVASMLAIRAAERSGRARAGSGASIGIFLVVYFGARLVLERFKAPMTEQLFGAGGVLREMLPALSATTGQWLSVVPALVGIVLVVRASRSA